MATSPTPAITNVRIAERIAMRGPNRLPMGEVCHASVCAAAPISQVTSPIAQAVAEPLPRIGKAQLGYRCPNRFGGDRERIHACGQRKRALCEELGELTGQPRQLPRDELRQLGDSSHRARLEVAGEVRPKYCVPAPRPSTRAARRAIACPPASQRLPWLPESRWHSWLSSPAACRAESRGRSSQA